MITTDTDRHWNERALSEDDDAKVNIYDTASHKVLHSLESDSPSGILFSTRAARTGF